MNTVFPFLTSRIKAKETLMVKRVTWQFVQMIEKYSTNGEIPGEIKDVERSYIIIDIRRKFTAARQSRQIIRLQGGTKSF